MVCKARSFLFFLFGHETLLDLLLEALTLSLMVTMELLAPPVVANPRYLAESLIDARTPFDL